MAPSPKVAEALSQIESQPESSKSAHYERLLREIKDFSSPSTATADLNAISSSFLSASLGIVSTRALLDIFAATIRGLKNTDMCIEVGTRVLAELQPSASSFAEHIAALRELVASAHEANEEYAEAAACLAKIPLDASQRTVTNAEAARIWVRIVRCFLEVDDTTAAEAYVNKLKNIMHTVSDPELRLHFELAQARIRDARRDFLDASKRYHDISFSKSIAEEERTHTLGMAIKCAVLAPAGPLRSRLLGRLYRDERAATLEDFGILEKMFFDRLLGSDEVEKFAKSLLPHQLATTSQGTVLDNAVVEHNLLGASRLYANIGFDALAALLGRDAREAEKTTARMIEQGRLVGTIDQVERIIWFGRAAGGAGAAAANGAGGEVCRELRRWDANVQGISEDVEQVINGLQNEFPAFVAANLHA